MASRFLALLGLFGLVGAVFSLDDPVFSGPQPGESLAPFKVRLVLGAQPGKEIDPIAQADGKPVLLVFVHEVNRPSVGMTRILTQAVQKMTKGSLNTAVIFLHEDAAEGEATINRVKQALTTEGVSTGVSLDGREGPGAYGLNRKVALTILVGDKGKVTSNFALIQPSLQADLPKVLESVAKITGTKPPRLEDLEGMPGRMAANPKGAPKSAGPDPQLRELLRPVIQKNGTDEEIIAAAKKVEEFCAKNETAKKEVGRIANTIINAGKLDNYGTAKSQEFLKKWAQEFGQPKGTGSDKDRAK